MTKKDELKFMLKQLFKEYNSNRTIYNGMLKQMKDRMPIGKFAQFYSLKDSDMEVRTEELYWMGKLFMREYEKIEEMYKEEYATAFKVEDYLNQREINKAENYSIEYIHTDHDTLVLNNVVRVADDEFICYKAGYYEISESFENGVAIYNFETQRNAKIEYSRTMNELIYKPRIFQNTIKDMYQAMKNHEFFPNMITWNILDTGAEKFTYDKKKNQLIFKRGEGSQINCIDGYHRTLAINKIISENPEFEGYMQIKIFNYTVDKARKFIRQEAKGNKISPKKLEQLESNKYTKMIEQINNFENEETNLMYHKVSETKEEVFKTKTKFVYNNTLKMAISENYDDLIKENIQETKEVREWLTTFLNEIIVQKSSSFRNIKNKEQNLTDTYNNVWTIYVTWSRLLYKDKRWKEKLSKLIREVDWTLDNPKWKEVSVMATRDDIRTSRKIIKYAEELASDIA